MTFAAVNSFPTSRQSNTLLPETFLLALSFAFILIPLKKQPFTRILRFQNKVYAKTNIHNTIAFAGRAV